MILIHEHTCMQMYVTATHTLVREVEPFPQTVHVVRFNTVTNPYTHLQTNHLYDLLYSLALKVKYIISYIVSIPSILKRIN